MVLETKATKWKRFQIAPCGYTAVYRVFSSWKEDRQLKKANVELQGGVLRSLGTMSFADVLHQVGDFA